MLLSFLLTHTTHREPLTVIGLARLYCYQQGRFLLVEVPKKEAKRKQQELNLKGYVVTHTEVV